MNVIDVKSVLGSEFMTKIKIVTDSTVDLTKEEIAQYGIEVVPLSIHIDGQTYLDKVDLTPSQFIEMMKESKELPKSSQPAVGEFVEIFNRLTHEGYEVLSIHMSEELSGTYNSAKSAKQLSDGNVHVVDSKYITRALGFQVVEAAKMALEGKQMKEILAHLEDIKMKTQLYVAVSTLENLVKGGRIGRGRALIGSLLHIKPIATLSDGIYTPVAKVRSESQIIKFLVKRFVEDIEGKIVKGIAIAHADAHDLSVKLKESLLAVNHVVDIKIVETTPIISTHTGPGAIGFTFYTE